MGTETSGRSGTRRIGVVLSGCGVMDGSEIHEATITLLVLDRLGAKVECFAPDVAQRDVVDHLAGQPSSERRNVLSESARIARGKIRPLSEAHASDLDGLVFPGGYGAAKNLTDFAVAGADATPDPEVARIVREMHAASRPLAFLCIAPTIAAATFRGTEVHPRLTIGNSADVGGALEKMGARNDVQPVDGVTVDRDNKIVSTPCYMYEARISEVERGVDRAMRALIELC